MKLSKQQRAWLVLGALYAGLGAVCGKLVYVQIVKHDALQALAEERQIGITSTGQTRGDILGANGETLALSKPAVSLYAHPSRLSSEERRALCAALRRAQFDRACSRLTTNAKFVWIARSVERERVEGLLDELRALRPKVGWTSGTTRVYPKGSLAGQLIGFVGVDGTGLEGIEKAMDSQLMVAPVRAVVLRDARRRLLLAPEDVEVLQSQKRNVELTIDEALQALVEQELSRSLAALGGKAAVALVAEVDTGAVRVAAVAPEFDPNHFREVSAERWRARFATDTYEPGSTVKPLLLATALQHGHRMHEVLFAENGRFTVDGHTISDDDPHGWLSLRDVVVKSSNIGAAKIGFALGKDALADAYRRYGFGDRLGVELPSESRGILRDVGRWSRLDWATLSFGQGLSVSPLQLLAAYLVVARNGSAVTPYFVERVFAAESGRTIWRHEPTPRQVFADGTVYAQVRSVLADVVREGTGVKAAVEGLEVGGKTGTAQKADLDRGGYREGAYVAWFVGMFPIRAPRWVAVVLVDEPSGSIYGGSVAAPVFHEVAEAVAIRDGLLARKTVIAEDAGSLPTAVEHAAEVVMADETVPDLRGLSLREAGRIAHRYRATVVPRGSGRIAAQEPAAGTRVVPGSTWRLRLAAEGA